MPDDILERNVKATLSIQGPIDAEEADDATPQLVDAHVIHSQNVDTGDGTLFTGVVDGAIDSSGNSAEFAEFDIANASPELVRSMHPGLFVHCTAGYIETGDDFPPEQSIFYGTIAKPIPSIEGSDRRLRLQCVARPPLMFLANVPVANYDGTLTIGASLQKLLNMVGASAKIHPFAFGRRGEDKPIDEALLNSVTLPEDYGASSTIQEEVRALIRRLNDVTGRRFAAVSRREEPWFIEVLLMDEEGGQQAIQKRLEPPTAFAASFTYSSDEPEVNLPVITSIESLKEAQRQFVNQSSRTGIKFSGPFDPRIWLGSLIVGRSAFLGDSVSMATVVTHRIGGDSNVTEVETRFVERQSEFLELLGLEET